MIDTNNFAFRFWLAMNSLFLVVILLLSSLFLWFESNQLEKILRNEGTSVANTLSSAIGLLMLNGDYAKISPLAYSLLDQPNVEYVIIRDGEGIVINQKGETIADVDLLTERVPIHYFSKYLGEIEVGLRADSLKKQRITLYFLTILLLVPTSYLALFISGVISRKLTTPLKNLMLASQEIAVGKRDIIVDEKGLTEIKELSQAFNRMSLKVQNHEQRLKDEIDLATKNLSEKIMILERLKNFSQSLLERNLKLKDLLALTLKNINDFISSDKVYIGLWNEKLNTIYTMDQQQQLVETSFQCSDTIRYSVLKKGEPLIREIDAENESSEYSFLEIKGLCTELMLPLISQQKVIGTLNLFNIDPNAYNEKTLEGIYNLIPLLSMAIDRAHAYESLERSAYYDYLTGLPNVRLFKERLMAKIEQKKHSTDSMLAVLFFDIDRFKMLNDSLGHDFGDKVINRVGELLLESLDERDTVARFGGDEFIILLPEVSHMSQIIDFAENIAAVFKAPQYIDGYEVHLTASIGIAVYPRDGEDAGTLIKHADIAMYRVKEQGKNSYAVYTPLVTDLSADQLFLENELHRALEENEFTVFYQPIVNIQTGRVTGMEALVRWNHPEKGMISPDKFIPIAEESGLIVPLGEYVLRSACKYNVELQSKGYAPIVVSVNLSTRQFLQANLYEMVRNILNETGIQPHLLELEITERMTMDIERAIPILNKLKNLGVSIAIDDFGTGYSSLSYLKNLPIDRLKIDRSFVTDITNQSKDSAIITTIINMALNLKLNVTAEGIEKEEQVKCLKEKGCQEIQGYYFSPPLAVNDFEKKLSDLMKE